MPDLPERVGIRAFARLDGCSHTAVQNGVRTGALKLFEDGTLDAALAGSAWRSGNRKTRRGGKPTKLPRQVVETPPKIVPWAEHLGREDDRLVVTAFAFTYHDIGAATSLAALEAGASEEVSRRLGPAVTLMAAERAAELMTALAIPPPPGAKAWADATMIDPDRLASVNWGLTSALRATELS